MITLYKVEVGYAVGVNATNVEGSTKVPFDAGPLPVQWSNSS